MIQWWWLFVELGLFVIGLMGILIVIGGQTQGYQDYKEEEKRNARSARPMVVGVPRVQPEDFAWPTTDEGDDAA